jgi:hypothetical protein
MKEEMQKKKSPPAVSFSKNLEGSKSHNVTETR